MNVRDAFVEIIDSPTLGGFSKIIGTIRFWRDDSGALHRKLRSYGDGRYGRRIEDFDALADRIWQLIKIRHCRGNDGELSWTLE